MSKLAYVLLTAFAYAPAVLLGWLFLVVVPQLYLYPGATWLAAFPVYGLAV